VNYLTEQAQKIDVTDAQLSPSKTIDQMVFDRLHEGINFIVAINGADKQGRLATIHAISPNVILGTLWVEELGISVSISINREGEVHVMPPDLQNYNE